MAEWQRRNPFDILADVVMGLLVALLATFVIARYAFGARAFAVLTGSMSPALEVGDVVVDTPADFEDIKVGDVITYVINDELDVATHRVVEKNAGERTLLTKGDANASNDGTPVDYRNVVGVMRLSVPRLGFVLSFLSTMTGKIVAITIIVAVTVIFGIAHTLVAMGSKGEGAVTAEQAVGQGAPGGRGHGEHETERVGTPVGLSAPSVARGRDNAGDDEYDGYPEDADYCDDDEFDDLFDDEDDDWLDDEDDWFDDEGDEFDEMPPLPSDGAGV